MMSIISKERVAFCTQVEGTQGDIFSASRIALQSWFKRVPNEPIPTFGHSWPPRQIVCAKLETDRTRRNCESAIGGRYAKRRILLKLGPENYATGVSLTSRTKLFHSDRGISPRRKYFLLIVVINILDSSLCIYVQQIFFKSCRHNWQISFVDLLSSILICHDDMFRSVVKLSFICNIDGSIAVRNESSQKIYPQWIYSSTLEPEIMFCHHSKCNVLSPIHSSSNGPLFATSPLHSSVLKWKNISWKTSSCI